LALLSGLGALALIGTVASTTTASARCMIDEGNGRFTASDRCRFFDIARGSGLECAGCLDLIFIKKLISEVELDQGKTVLQGVVSLLVGLIRSNSPDRLQEEAGEYRVGGEQRVED